MAANEPCGTFALHAQRAVNGRVNRRLYQELRWSSRSPAAMLKLLTLGDLRLVGPTGELLSKRRTPLLLLAYLARHSPRPVARSELASLIWGERAETKARHSLRQALLELGRLCGDRLVVTPTTARLEPDTVELDVALFERDVDAGRHADAVARWTGEFLDQADDRAEMALQLWLDTERSGLRRRLGLAFDAVLDEADRSGATREAVRDASRWAELAPLDEHACRRLIATLVRTGRPNDALVAHSEFVTRHREMLGVAPSRDFMALSRKLDATAHTETARRGHLGGSSPSIPLVGRARHVWSLEEAWRKASSGAPVAMVVAAAPGLGATRLCEELAQRCNGSGTVLLAAGPTGSTTPFGTAKQVFAGLGDSAALGGLSAETLAVLGELIPLHDRFPHIGAPHAPTQSAAAIGAAIAEAIDALGEDGPVLVVADALQDADPASRELLLDVASRVRGPVMTLFTSHDDDAKRTSTTLRERGVHVQTAALDPLTTQDVALAIDGVVRLQRDQREALAVLLHRDTAGIPRYVVGAIAALLDERMLRPGAASQGDVVSRLDGRALPIHAAVSAHVRSHWTNAHSPGLPRPPVVQRVLAERTVAQAPAGLSKRRWLVALVAGTTVVVAAAAAFWPRPPVFAPTDRTVAVFPFAVSSTARTAYLRAGMVDLLSTSLDGVGGYHTIDPRAVIAATPRDASLPLDAGQALAIARRLGASYFVLGTVVDAGGRLQVAATLHDARGNGASKAQARASGEEGALFAIVDRVTAQLAVAQGAPAGERLAALAAVTTTSLEALKAYLEGRNAYRSNDLQRALESYERAVGSDSSFALAWYGLASAASWLLRPALEQRAAAEAVRQSGRLSARDRTMVQAFDAYARGDAETAERLATTLTEMYDDIESWVLLGEVLYHHNWKRGRSMRESRAVWIRVLELDPSYWPALQHLGEVAAIEGRRGEADSLLARYERAIGPGRGFLATLALRAHAFGDSAARAALVPRLSSDRGFQLIASIWYVSVYGADLPGAHALANLLVQPLRPPEQQGFGRVLLAHLDLARGKWREARAELAIARAHTPREALEHELLLSLAPHLQVPRRELERLAAELRDLPSPTAPLRIPWPQPDYRRHAEVELYLDGMVRARGGDETGWRRSVAELRGARSRNGSAMLSAAFMPSIEAEALRRTQPDQALRALELGTAVTPFVVAWTSAFMSQAYERYVRAELLHAAGRDADALRWYETIPENSPYDLVYLGPSLYRQGRIHEAHGRRDEARAKYRRFVDLWRDADPELRPLVDDAQTRLRGL